MTIHPRLLTTLVIAGLAGPAFTAAQTPAAPAAPSAVPAFAARPMLVSRISEVEGRELILQAITLQPGASSPPHTHPGDCYGAVVEGEIEFRLAGHPARRLKAGEAYANANPNVPHQFTNVGTTPVRMVNTLVVEKGKPAVVLQKDPVP